MADARATRNGLLAERYRLVERLASGGMGEVWQAHDEHVDRQVAVKLLREDLAADPAAVERFRREARTAALLTHPNVASVFDVVDGDSPAIIMELVDGHTLAARLDGGPLPVDEAVGVGDAVLAALEAAHAAGIVHRDVTPGNVLMATDGRVKVADFGIARTEQEGTRLTDTGNVVGTAQYLAPEQLRDEPPTPATDQYAAGIVLYEALTGTRPFEAATPAAAAVARLHVPPTPLRDRRADVPEALAAVVMRALAREPRDRFASVGEMRAALHAATAASRGRGETTVTDLPVAAGTTAVMTNPVHENGHRPPRPPRDRGGRVLLLVLGVAALLLVAGLVARANDGPATVEVPALAGTSVEDATATLEDAGLTLAPVTVDGEQPEGTILTQNVAPGTKVEQGTKVGVEVSSGTPPCCTVPHVVGMALADAQAAVGDAGLALGVVEATDADLAPGTVVDQDPDAGTAADPGAAVNLLVARQSEGDEDRGKGQGKGDD